MKTPLIVVLVAAAALACAKQPSAKIDAPNIVEKTGVVEMTPQEARPGAEAAYAQFIDVRTSEEFAAGHAARARNIPLDELPNKLDTLEKSEPVYLICRSGVRSKKVAELLVQNGFKQAISIAGGTDAWSAAGLPMSQ